MTAFRVDSLPIPQPRHRVGRWGAYLPCDHPVHGWKEEVRFAYQTNRKTIEPLAGPVYLEAHFVLPAKGIKSQSTRKPHVKVPDLDNLLKSLKDALNGLAWSDDCQVVQIRASKAVGALNEAPHCEVVISSITEW